MEYLTQQILLRMCRILGRVLLYGIPVWRKKSVNVYMYSPWTSRKYNAKPPSVFIKFISDFALVAITFIWLGLYIHKINPSWWQHVTQQTFHHHNTHKSHIHPLSHSNFRPGEMDNSSSELQDYIADGKAAKCKSTESSSNYCTFKVEQKHIMKHKVYMYNLSTCQHPILNPLTHLK